MNGAMPGLVSGVVLAAGSARRMNGNKLLLDVGGRPLVRFAVEEAVAANLAEVLVVVSDANAHVIGEAIADIHVKVVTNARSTEGMGTSVACAAACISPDSNALLLLQGDQPLVARTMLRRLIECWEAESPPFVASRYDELVTTPVLFDKSLFKELAALDGDRGAKTLLDKHKKKGKTVGFPTWRGADVDTPEDYRRVRDLAALNSRT